MTPKDLFTPVSEGLSPLSGPNINDERGKSTADKGPEITLTRNCWGVTREMVALHNPQHQGANNQLMPLMLVGSQRTPLEFILL